MAKMIVSFSLEKEVAEWCETLPNRSKLINAMIREKMKLPVVEVPLKERSVRQQQDWVKEKLGVHYNGYKSGIITQPQWRGLVVQVQQKTALTEREIMEAFK